MKTGRNNGKELDEDEIQSVVRYYTDYFRHLRATRGQVRRWMQSVLRQRGYSQQTKDRIIECMGLETKWVQNNEHQPSNSDGTADG